MKPLEIALLYVNVPVLAWMLTSRRPWPTLLEYVPLLGGVLAIIQIALEGYRWQMIPAYLLIAGLLVVGSWPVSRAGLDGWVLGALGSGLLAGATVAGLIFPLFRLPAPDGRFTVGTAIRYLVDTSRIETWSDTHYGPRELMIQFWYPADGSAHRHRAPYVLDRRQIESSRFSYLTLVQTDAVLDAPVSTARTRFPVLIYSPSWRGARFQNTFLAEDLASHGFVVVAIDHPYGSAVTLFPGGRVVRASVVNAPDFSSDEALARSIRYLDQQLRIRVDDVRFVLRELSHFGTLGSGDPFSGRLDLERVGIFGFSFGGAVAGEVCRVDKRFKAGINMEGWMWGDAAEAGIEQPFMFMDDYSEPPVGPRVATRDPMRLRQQRLDERDVRLEKHSLETYGGYSIAIRGTGHANFGDSALYSPVRRLTGAGPIDPRRGLRIVAAYAFAFFEQSLNHRNQPLLDGLSPAFPEVLFVSCPPPSTNKGSIRPLERLHRQCSTAPPVQPP